MNQVPFQIGDRVKIHVAEVTEFPGLVFMSPDPGHVGKEGVIRKLDFYPNGVCIPDADIDLDNGDRTSVDICFLSKVEQHSFQAAPIKASRKRVPPMTPQCEKLLSHLTKGHSLTQRSALIDFGVSALTRRICDLRERGYNIVSTPEVNNLTGSRYVRYTLGKPARRAA